MKEMPGLRASLITISRSIRTSSSNSCYHGHQQFMLLVLTCSYLLSGFALVNADDGEPILGQKEGLLLYRNGTVCDNGFSDQSADAICRGMGYYAAKQWRTSLESSGQQNSRNVAMGSVSCTSSLWSSCELTESNSCSHDNDVFLHCYCKFSAFVHIRDMISDLITKRI